MYENKENTNIKLNKLSFTDTSVPNTVFPNSCYSINAQHKDSLFRLVFKDKTDLLDLYNTCQTTINNDS